MEFQAGDKAIYPSHGIAEIRGIEDRDVGGREIEGYVLNIVSSGTTVFVPIAAAKKAGIRGLSSHGELKRAMELLREPVRFVPKAWNKRSKEFNEKLRSGSTCRAAEVFRDLKALSKAKNLSYGEKVILEKSKNLLISEFCAVKNLSASQIEMELNSCLKM